MKVLIPVDGSEQALRTIKAAARFLDRDSSRLYLLTVRVPVPAEVPWAMMEDETSLNAILDRARQEAVDAGLRVEKSEYTTYHEPATAICQYADEIGADLIVMGSHGHQGLAKFLMGSVSERVFKQAHQPVVVVRNDEGQVLEIRRFKDAGLQSSGRDNP